MSDTAYMNEDAVLACVDLVVRCGARGFEMGYVHDDVPLEEAGWYAHAEYQGARIMVQDHRSPTTAAQALAERLLRGAMCACRRMVTLNDQRQGCRWRQMGPRWEPGCDAPPVEVRGERGDTAAMVRAMQEPAPPANRAERRSGGKPRPMGKWRRRG